MIPSFRHMGGKARLRRWLVEHFPQSGTWYVEPFAGKGNVYFLARQHLNFRSWLLADIDASFLYALKHADFSALPDEVTKADFPRYRDDPTNRIAKLIEPRITFAGKGYASGYSGHSGTHVGYSGNCYRVMCEQARALLSGTLIAEGAWDVLLRDPLFQDPEAFGYFDPPYVGTKASYPNIDHVALVQQLNDAPFMWALSGYRNDLYDSQLVFKCRFEYERNSEIKSSNTGKREPVVEVLWTNYEL